MSHSFELPTVLGVVDLGFVVIAALAGSLLSALTGSAAGVSSR